MGANTVCCAGKRRADPNGGFQRPMKSLRGGDRTDYQNDFLYSQKEYDTSQSTVADTTHDNDDDDEGDMEEEIQFENHAQAVQRMGHQQEHKISPRKKKAGKGRRGSHHHHPQGNRHPLSAIEEVAIEHTQSSRDLYFRQEASKKNEQAGAIRDPQPIPTVSFHERDNVARPARDSSPVAGRPKVEVTERDHALKLKPKRLKRGSKVSPRVHKFLGTRGDEKDIGQASQEPEVLPTSNIDEKEPEPEPSHDSEPKPESKSETKSETKSGPKMETKSEPKTESNPKFKTESNLEPEVQAKAKSVKKILAPQALPPTQEPLAHSKAASSTPTTSQHLNIQVISETGSQKHLADWEDAQKREKGEGEVVEKPAGSTGELEGGEVAKGNEGDEGAKGKGAEAPIRPETTPSMDLDIIGEAKTSSATTKPSRTPSAEEVQKDASEHKEGRFTADSSEKVDSALQKEIARRLYGKGKEGKEVEGVTPRSSRRDKPRSRKSSRSSRISVYSTTEVTAALDDSSDEDLPHQEVPSGKLNVDIKAPPSSQEKVSSPKLGPKANSPGGLSVSKSNMKSRSESQTSLSSNLSDVEVDPLSNHPSDDDNDDFLDDLLSKVEEGLESLNSMDKLAIVEK